jgi:hypothetical protein
VEILMSPQTADEAKKATGKKAVACDNHPDRDAVMVTDGKNFQELHLCEACIPPGWDKEQ